MQKPAVPEKRPARPADYTEVPFGSNEVRLSPGQWVMAGAILLAILYFAPALWEQVEPLNAGADYRIPYSLGHDYWTYGRYCRQVARQDKTPLIGDSVIWGHYVDSDETLSHYLNELAGEERFANLGVDGVEPVAMAGLVKFYGADVAGMSVILHLNLLWTANKKADLQTTKERSLTHPRLVPQFFPRIPCYRESLSGRIGIVVGREIPLLAWTNHMQIAHFENSDLPTWTMKHPYANPAGAVTLELPSPDEPPSPKPVAKPWTENPNFKRKDDFRWVELETAEEKSLQWDSFKRTVETLRARGNRVFVLVGPFNEHKLTDKSLEIYNARKRRVEAWLEANGIPHAVPAALPSRYYADGSHPLSEGGTTPTEAIRSARVIACWRPGCWKTRRLSGSETSHATTISTEDRIPGGRHVCRVLLRSVRGQVADRRRPDGRGNEVPQLLSDRLPEGGRANCG